jgi:subtilisin family serine protease
MIRTISSIFIVLTNLTSPIPQQRTIQIAILDTGIDIHDTDLVFCKGLSKDFTGEGIEDKHGHGTNIAYIIRHFAKDRPYCIIVVKVLNGERSQNRLKDLIRGMNYVADLNPDIVNVSLTGQGAIPSEMMAVRRILNGKTIFVAAAGNDNQDLDKECNIFPACYSDQIISVGNLGRNGEKNPSSNYGNYIKRWEMGSGILAGGIRLSGTSQAAAISSGKLAREMK